MEATLARKLRVTTNGGITPVQLNAAYQHREAFAEAGFRLGSDRVVRVYEELGDGSVEYCGLEVRLPDGDGVETNDKAVRSAIVVGVGSRQVSKAYIRLDRRFRGEPHLFGPVAAFLTEFHHSRRPGLPYQISVGFDSETGKVTGKLQVAFECSASDVPDAAEELFQYQTDLYQALSGE